MAFKQCKLRYTGNMYKKTLGKVVGYLGECAFSSSSDHQGLDDGGSASIIHFSTQLRWCSNPGEVGIHTAMKTSNLTAKVEHFMI